MDPEAAQYPASLQPSDEALEALLNEVRTWQFGRLPTRTFAYCVIAWPRVREIALKEWRERLADPYNSDTYSSLPTVAWYIAAAKRDGAFLQPFLDGLRRDENTIDLLYGDLLTNDGAPLMALMAGGSDDDIAAIEEAALPRQDVAALTNNVPLGALALLVAEGAMERERFNRVVRQCIQGILSPEFAEDAYERLGWLAITLCEFGVGDFAAEMRGWFDRGLLETGSMAIIDPIYLDEAIDRGPTVPDPEWYGRKRIAQILDDTYGAMDWMMHGEEEDYEDASFDYGFTDPDEVTMPLYRTEPKIGRNDPCPCNSGRKYKKCCGKAG